LDLSPFQDAFIPQGIANKEIAGNLFQNKDLLRQPALGNKRTLIPALFIGIHF